MTKYLRAMLDTNVYALLYKSGLEKISEMVESGKLVVYGCGVIRKELRAIPPAIKEDGKSYRNSLLGVYDKLAGKHDVPVAELSHELAKQYIKEYTGGTSRYKIYADFLIVATATIHGLDLIVTEDEKTMKSRLARAAYNKVNEKNGLTTSVFVELEKLNL
ncbi:MAG TPA: hypothetical protein VFF13_05525 [archaeon]|nr:hypothetical protein [archaeon]